MARVYKKDRATASTARSSAICRPFQRSSYHPSAPPQAVHATASGHSIGVEAGVRVLVACEYSGIVRDAFTARGHYAMSADLLPTESPGPHHQGDVLDVLDVRGTSWWRTRPAPT